MLKPRIEKGDILKAIEKLPNKQRTSTSKRKEETPAEPVVTLPTSPITSQGEFWTIPNVVYRGRTEPYDLSKTLLSNGVAKTQDEWAQHYEIAKPRGEFHAMDFPLFYGILKSLKEQNAEEARKFLQEQARAKWLMTITRIRYAPIGLDEIMHNYKTKDQYKKQVDFITPDELIKNTKKPESYQALLDTQDSVKQINSVFKWLNKTDTYAWKINEKPDNLIETVARFVADSGWAYLGCDWDPDIAFASLGVRRAKNLGGTA